MTNSERSTEKICQNSSSPSVKNSYISAPHTNTTYTKKRYLTTLPLSSLDTHLKTTSDTNDEDIPLSYESRKNRHRLCAPKNMVSKLPPARLLTCKNSSLPHQRKKNLTKSYLTSQHPRIPIPQNSSSDTNAATPGKYCFRKYLGETKEAVAVQGGFYPHSKDEVCSWGHQNTKPYQLDPTTYRGFENAQQVWFWFMAAWEAQEDGARPKAGMGRAKGV